VYVKGPEYSNLLLDKTSNISHEKTLVEGYGGRIHFTSGETFSSTKLSHFLLSSTEAAQDNPLLRNDRVMFRDMSSRGFTLEDVKGFLGGRCSAQRHGGAGCRLAAREKTVGGQEDRLSAVGIEAVGALGSPRRFVARFQRIRSRAPCRFRPRTARCGGNRQGARDRN